MNTDEEFRAIKDQLDKPPFIADVLKYAALLEGDLDVCLAQYFCASGKHFTFVDLICSRLRYEGKVQLLESLEIRKSLKSRLLALDGLRRIQKIRNLVAHAAFIPKAKIVAFQKDRIMADMILGPYQLRNMFCDARRGLYFLSHSKEWRRQAVDRTPGRIDFFHARWDKDTNA